ncbi:MAG: CoA-binding protein [Planctomycetes bacterium]|nr:CoA-binding protein [Planctomycetota bacterium]
MGSTVERDIEAFLSRPHFAVVGASTNRSKYGNKVLRCYQQNGRSVTPVNPRATEIEGIPAVPDLSLVEPRDCGVSIITPPAITEAVIDEAISLGISHLWLQPGSESPAAIARAEKEGLVVIHGGPCLLVVLGFRESGD